MKIENQLRDEVKRKEKVRTSHSHSRKRMSKSQEEEFRIRQVSDGTPVEYQDEQIYQQEAWKNEHE
jgi:hypothetical protein